MARPPLEGFKELENWLKQFPDRIVNKAVRKATREGAKVVAEDAKALAPVDEGDLEASIKVRALKRSRRKRVGHSIQSGSSKEFTADGLPFYASFVELGTKKMKADPFLRPALWGNEAKVRAVFVRILKAFLRGEQNKF